MNLNRRLEPLPEFETSYSARHDALLLAVILVVGLAFVTPTLALAVGVPTLVGVALTGIAFGVAVLVMRRIVVGLFVGLIVTATFAANVPLSSQAYTAEVVGHLGPELWLVDVPLAGILAYLIVTIPERERILDPSRAELVFGAFVVWTILAAAFGAVARLDVALWFSAMMLQALLVFVACRHLIQTGVLSLRTVVDVVALTVCAHATVGLAQLANGESFGLSFLGGGLNAEIAVLSLGPLNEVPIGVFVMGFTGMAFQLAALIVLVAPVLLALAIYSSGGRRWVLAGTTLVLVAVLRATGTDAGRGGFVVTIITFAGALAALYRRGLLDLSVPNRTDVRALRRTILPTAVATLAGVVTLFYPSSESGVGSSITDLNVGRGAAGGSGGASGGSSTGGSGATSAPSPEPGVVESTLHGLSIPFFDISTLGIRLQQYVIGLDMFIAHPIFGVGGANFAYLATEYGLPRPMPLHSIYIALLAETGLPGLVLYIATLVIILWYGWQAAMAERTGRNRLLLVGVLSGMVGFLAFQFWAILLLVKVSVLFPFWILAGAVVGSYAKQTQ